MAEFTITELVQSRPWQHPTDPTRNTIYFDVRVEGQDKPLNFGRKPGNEPKVGDVLRGDVVDEGKATLKFVKENNFGGGGGGGGKTYERTPDHPIQMQRILHTSAMSMTPPLIEQMLTLGVVEKPADKAGYLNLVQGVASWVLASYPASVLAQAEKADAA